jgi:pantetheine-phosphate adenylyltransferase
MSSGLYPGTFDPPTLGHLDIILRAAKICKKLFVGVAKNESKQECAFSLDERVNFLKQLVLNEKNVEIVRIDSLIVDFINKEKIDFIIRGLRPFSYIEKEFQMALANKKIGGVETLFFASDGKYAHISSSLIREVASWGHHLKDFVPEQIEIAVANRLRKPHKPA